jgi:hypothetical protein
MIDRQDRHKALLSKQAILGCYAIDLVVLS